MRLLVTGAAGFIGSHFCERAVGKGYKIIGVDDFNDYYDPNVKRRNVEALAGNPLFRLVEADILNTPLMEAVFQEHAFDAVIHLAARAGVRSSIREPMLYQRVNVEGTVGLMERSVRHHIKKFILASSSSVYGNNNTIPFREDANVDFPISPYAATKRACEILAYTFHVLYGLSVTCLRFFTVYGPRQRPDMAIHKFTRLIAEGKPIPVFGNGTTRRDYTYIDDILDGVERSLDRADGYAIYNLGESKTVELQRLIQLIEQALRRKAVLQRLDEQPGDMPITCADVSLAEKELGYHPRVSIE
ncbi:MAG TPA: NAD-dependent epimerase/dehydratase family protein, partial [bacterium]